MDAGELGGDPRGPVAGRPDRDDQLELARVVLRQHARDAGAEVALLVAHGHEHADPRPAGQRLLHLLRDLPQKSSSEVGVSPTLRKRV